MVTPQATPLDTVELSHIGRRMCRVVEAVNKLGSSQQGPGTGRAGGQGSPQSVKDLMGLPKSVHIHCCGNGL
jgi:hypothetical protein